MTRVVTGAALVGLLQGVVLTLLLGVLGLSSFTGGSTGYAGAYGSSVVLTTTPTLGPRLGLVLVLAVVAAVAAAVAQHRGWLGPRPDPGHPLAGRLGAAAVLAAAVGQLPWPEVATVAFGPARESSLPRRYADYLPPDHSRLPWVVVGAAVAAGIVLVVLAALREGRGWARPALGVVLVLAAAGVLAQVVLLDGLVLAALVGEVLALLLGGTALALARR